MDSLISIIVPVYNKKEYLQECFDSLARQNYQNIEVIMVDDGSTDGADKICKYYEEKDDRFHYLYQKNSGQNAARKRGLDVACGKWVMFVDADDYVVSDICLQFISEQKRSGSDIVFGQMQKVQNGKISAVTRSLSGVYNGLDAIKLLFQPQKFLAMNPIGMVPILYKKEIVAKALNKIDKKIRYGEDCGCTIYSLLGAKKVTFLPIPVYFYRQNDMSFGHSHNKSNIYCQKLLQMFLRISFQEYNVVKDFARLAIWLIVRNLLLGGYEYFADYKGVYPFKEMNDGKKIAIYGAGVFGEEIHDKLSNRFIVTDWYDGNATYYQKMGKKVKGRDEIDEMKYDYLLVAVTNYDSSRSIMNRLRERLKYPDKVLVVSENIIDSEYTKKKLEELENVDESYSYVPSAVSSSSRK